jgi:hypothetical protein
MKFTKINMLGFLFSLYGLSTPMAGATTEDHGPSQDLPSIEERTIVSQVIEEIPTIETVQPPMVLSPPLEWTFPPTTIDYGAIINLGKAAWSIVENNQPVVNLAFDFANALPKGVNSAYDLNGFSDIVYRSYNASGRNIFGANVYEVKFTLMHQYGGSFDGQGQYLATVAVIPSQVKVMWGNKLNFSVKHVNTVNVGTQVNPIAALSLLVSYDVKSFGLTYSRNIVYEFRGDSEQTISSEPDL